MAKRDKLLAKFLAVPPPKDFRWDELVSLMRSMGFRLDEPGGGSSHKYFVLIEDENRVIHTTRQHPENTIKTYQIKQIKDKLQEWGYLRDE